jgi:hypothetical protein
MSDVPTVEPTSLRAGDTWSWSRALSDYPAPTWVLSYALLNSTSKISITAAADGADHLVSVLAATSSGYAAGVYSAVGRVASGAESHTVWSGAIEVLPNLAAATTYDDRSHARKVLEAIEAVLQNRATNDQQEVAIADRQIKKIPLADLLKFRTSYKLEVAAEEAAAQLASGVGGRGRILARL